MDGHLNMMGGYLEFFMEPATAILNPRMDLHAYHELISAMRFLLPGDKCHGSFVFNRHVLYDISKPYIGSVPPPAPLVSRVESGPGGDNSKGQLHTLLTPGQVIPSHTEPPNYQTISLGPYVNSMACSLWATLARQRNKQKKMFAAEALDRVMGDKRAGHDFIGNMSTMLKKNKKNQE